MNIARLSVKRPIFITCIVIALIAVGLVGFKQLPVDLYPEADIPIVAIATIYQGAGPSEIETLVTKPLEDSLSNIAGVKKLSSKSLEGVSRVTVEFNQGVDGKYAEQLVRDKVNQTKPKFPQDTKEPVITKVDMSALPIMMLSLDADLPDAQLYDLADQVIKPQIEQIDKVGSVEIMGGRKREIQVLLDRNKLKAKELSLLQVADRVGAAGQNIPAGKVDNGTQESTFRALGDFRSPKDVAATVVSLYGNEFPTRISDIGKVVDTVEDEKVRFSVDNNKAVGMQIYRQSGANTVAVADAIKAKLASLQPELDRMPGHPRLSTIIDSSKQIREEVSDVYLTIILAVILTVVMVFLFLANVRSTLITALSLPISLVGTCVLLYLAGFSINIVTLMAMSLAVGLLVDDAIVVIENIYRRIENGEPVMQAAVNGCGEIQLSVTAISLVIISVFLPMSFISGTVGQMLKQFGLTVAFAMVISLFVALTIVPMLTAHLATAKKHGSDGSGGLLAGLLSLSDRLQDWLSEKYERLLRVITAYPRVVLIIAGLVFLASSASIVGVTKNFVPDSDNGLLIVNIEKAPGTNLDGIQSVAQEVDAIVKKHPDVALSALIIGSKGQDIESNKAMVMVKLKDERALTTSQFKTWLRGQLKPVAYANPKVQNYDVTGSGGALPLMIDLMSPDGELLQQYADKILAKLKADKRLKDVDYSYQPGKPELQVILDDAAARTYGVNSRTMGMELRGQVEGFTPAKFREKGYEYDVRVRLQPEQRDLKKSFNSIYIPNVNYRQVRLADVAKAKEASSVTSIDRQNRGRYIQITADLAPGVGLGDVMTDLDKSIREDIKLPPQVRYSYAGRADSYREMMGTMAIAFGFAVLFIFLILSSLYESFVTPFTILLALPLALCGAFLALFVTGASLDIFAIFGLFMLIGVAGKNSILLVDFILQRMQEGHDRVEAILLAGRDRLRPILMTSLALIAGSIPIAIGINAASAMRTSMGIVIVGGMISSTLLTLLVVPAVFSYVNRFETWLEGVFARISGKKVEEQPLPPAVPGEAEEA